MNPADESTSWTPDGLVAHNARLRRLAVGLAGETDADDLVQDAWGAALQHSGKGVESPTAWLSGAVRHLAQMMRRGEARRRRRERVAARGEAIASPEVAVARVELHREIADAVLGLPEIARQVVILRFFEDLTPAEIAEHLGMPAATVRTRLHRALERLRVRLDAAHGGERSAWAALVLPGALARDAGVSGSSAVAAKGLVGGVIAVSVKKLLIGAGIALALVAVGIVVSREQGPEEGHENVVVDLAGREYASSGTGAVEPNGPPAITTEPFVAPTSEAPGSEKAAPRPGPKTAIVRGTVRIRDEGPLREGRVFLWGYDKAADELDEDGGFRIETRYTEIRSLFWRQDGVQLALPCRVRPSFESETVVDVVIAPGTVLEGRLISAASGAPVGGASIVLRRPYANASQQADHAFLESREDGCFAIPCLPRGQFTLEIDHPRFTTTAIPFEMPRERPLLVELEPGRPLVITLRNYEHYRRFDKIVLQCNAFEADARGVERHTGVAAMLEGSPDEDGKLIVNAPAPGIWTYELFSYGGFPTQRGRLIVPEGTAPLRLEVTLPVPGLATVTGVVRDGAGEPVQQATLCLGNAHAKLAADGSYRLDAVRTGRARLTLRVGSGMEQVERALGAIDIPECEAFSHDFALPGTARIVVFLVDVPENLRAEHFDVLLRDLGGGGDPIAWGTGSPDKTMTFSWLAPGRYRLSPRLDSLSLADREIEVPMDGDEVRVVLRPEPGVPTTFRIRVPAGVRLPATVDLTSPPYSGPGSAPDVVASQRVSATLAITPEGLGRTALFTAGRHEISFSGLGFTRQILGIVIDPEREEPVEVTLEPER
jgi:RNA polymerase sigma-70 factor (ECF subfamily)